jgi:hypothetical protein
MSPKRARARLTRPIRLKDGTTLKTVLEASHYMAALPEHIALRNTWQHAAKLILDGASPEEITKQIEGALFVEAKLDLPGSN